MYQVVNKNSETITRILQSVIQLHTLAELS